MIEKYLWITGSLIFLILGTLHLLYTFFTKKLFPRDSSLIETMKISFPVLTKETTMWKTWIGFNASHSCGGMYIGLVNIILAIKYPEVIQSPVMLLLNMSTAVFYLWLGKKYWFCIPFTGILIATCCFTIATFIVLLK